MRKRVSQWALEPAAQIFVESLAVNCQVPLSTNFPQQAREMLAELQSGPIGRPAVCIEDVEFPLSAGGYVRARIIRPPNLSDVLPTVVYFHGGGWALGDVNTHDRLVREITLGAHAAVVFVQMSRAPEVQYPCAIEEAYGATRYIASHGAALSLDGSRIAVAGDGSGGNVAAAVTLLAKQRRGPKIIFQVLLCPVTDSRFTNASYTTFRDGPWLTRRDMKRFWNAYLPNSLRRAQVTACPLRATVEQLRGLPDALVITAENDVLRDEGEDYARKLAAAGSRVTATRYIGTIHDFVLLNALADSPPTRGAIEQIAARLRSSLE